MTATALHADLPPQARRLTAAGAVLFLVSDTLLGARQFLVEDSPQRLETVVMATYTTAQLLLAEGAARASARGRDRSRQARPPGRLDHRKARLPVVDMVETT